jgi:hypothetical protein
MIRLLAVLAAGALLCGCAARPPVVGTVSFTATLEKPTYRALVAEGGGGANEVTAFLSLCFSSGGNVGGQGGVGLRIPLTNEVTLVGRNRLDTDEVVFRLPLKWGRHTYRTEVRQRRMVLFLVGHGPIGRISRYVGELDLEGPAAAYEILIRRRDPPPVPAAAPTPP